jgi:hypothetical protein
VNIRASLMQLVPCLLKEIDNEVEVVPAHVEFAKPFA